MSTNKRSLLQHLRSRLFAKLNISIVTGDNQRVSVGNRGTVTLDDNQPIKE